MKIRICTISAIMSLCLAFSLSVCAQEQPEIEIKIEPTKKAFGVGEAVAIRVEVWNRGQRDLLVSRHLSQIGSEPAYIKFQVQDSSGQESPDTAGVLERIRPNPESLAAAVLRTWIGLPPQFSYGRLVHLRASAFPFLKRPGRYRISATYVSRGISAQIASHNLVNARPEDISSLPFQAWEGEVSSNSVWVTIVPRGKRTPGKESQ